MQRGFSLVELSIVLVILGLLTGGILAGQSLIHAAELRTVSRDATRYKAAIYSFRDKYFGLPGDITNATSFWGKDAVLCNGQSGTAATPGTCNGTGDSLVDWTPESTTSFQQMALAGLVEGNFTSIYQSESIPGTNQPKSRINPSAGFMVLGNAPSLLLGGSSTAGIWLTESAISPIDAWNVDTKMDDGLPTTGKITAGGGFTSPAAQDNTICYVGTAYVLTQTAPKCYMGFN